MGDIIEFELSGAQNSRGFPHRHEDLIVVDRPVIVDSVVEEDLAGALSDSESPSVAEVFGHCLEAGKYVSEDTDCHSLGAVRVSREHIRFYENRWSTLKCSFMDASGAAYDLSVTSVAVNDLWETEDLDALSNLGESAPYAHVRVGLANAWDNRGRYNPRRCYAMLNGIAFY